MPPKERIFWQASCVRSGAFEGMVTTDWWNKAYQYKEIKAGNDLKMGSGDPDEVLAALKEGKVTRAEIETCAARILETIMKLD